jgi:glycosyltransferase involved in cell wall biosynthesis
MKKVSIILCVYNAEQTLADTLDSVLNQTYPHYELVVVDDGSTDDSAAILSRYAPQFAEINITYQQNQGLGPARNTAIAQAKHDLIAFIDADDLWHVSKLEQQIAAFTANPDAACIICDCQEFVNEAELQAISAPIALAAAVIRLHEIFVQLAEVNFNFQPVGSLWLKDVFMQFGGFTDDRSGQDYYPFLVAALHDQVFYRIPQPLYFVRVVPNSLSRSTLSPYRGALARVKAIDRILVTEKDLHLSFLTADKQASLEKGQQKFLRWVLYGVRQGFARTKMPAVYLPYLFRISSWKIRLLELLKLLAALLSPVYPGRK